VIKIFLVQRIMLRISCVGQRTGVDSFFAMDYMGSSEFEFGALPASLRAMREMPRPEIHRIKVSEHIAWFVGPTEIKDDVTGFFRDQLDSQPKLYLRERSRIHDAYVGGAWDGEMSDHIGWWDIKNHWAFFMKKDYAQEWIDRVWPTNMTA